MSDARTSTYRTPPSRTFLIAHAALTALGVACLFLPGKLTIRLVHLLPVAFTVRSGGTSLEAFAVLGPSIIRRFGACLLLGVGLSTAWLVLPHTTVQRIAATCRRACSLPHTSSRTRTLCRSVLLFAVPFAAFFWLSTPHNAFSTNSRIHWVDYLTLRSDVFFYAGGRIPHFLFYEHPSLWQGINAGLLALTIDAILRRLSFGRWSAAALSLLFFGAGILLIFGDTGEDVLLNFLLLSLLLLSLTHHSALLRGLALALVVIGRPEFFSMFGAYLALMLYDLWCVRRSTDGDHESMRSRSIFHATVFGWAAAGVAASQVLFTIFGERYLFINGQILDLGPLKDLKPITLDGFTISPFSGANFGHFLWVLPIGFTVCLAAFAIDLLPSRRRNEDPWPLRNLVAAFCIFATAATVLLHELKPIEYLNVRYLAYTYPFVFVGGAVAIEGIRSRRPRSGVLLWTIAISSLFVLPVHPLQHRDHLAARIETQLFDHVDELRDARHDGIVVATFGGRSTKNAMAYVFRMAPGNVLLVKPVAAGTTPGSILIVRRDQQVPPPPNATELFSTSDLRVYRLAP